MCKKNLAHLFFMSYIYVALILRLRVADNLTRKEFLVLSVTVEAANLFYAYTTLLCDAHERLARLNLVVKLFARRAGRISAHFATVNLLSGVTAVANLATGSVSLSILVLVTVTLEIVEIASDILVAEIEEQGWVQCHTTETGLEMEMRTGASTCIATQANHFSSSYFLILGNELRREVTVDGLQTIVVTNYDELSVTTSVISYDANLA